MVTSIPCDVCGLPGKQRQAVNIAMTGGLRAWMTDPAVQFVSADSSYAPLWRRPYLGLQPSLPVSTVATTFTLTPGVDVITQTLPADDRKRPSWTKKFFRPLRRFFTLA